MSILVVDVGTSSVRAAIVEADATVHHEQLRPLLPDSPAPGLVEFDATEMANVVLDAAHGALEIHGGPVDAVGITNQRGSTIVWDRKSGEPIGPGIGWQDLRTIGTCLEQRANGFRFAPNVAATKLSYLLDTYDPNRERDLCFGTVDTWVAWTLSQGALHVSDASNAGITSIIDLAGDRWDPSVLEALNIPEGMLPTLVDSSGVVGPATALPGAPPIASLVGDQQASLAGQGCVHPGPAKITFGTGGMLDVVFGPKRPGFETRGEGGTFPIVTWRRDGVDTWGLEAIMLSAGTNIEWLRDDLGILASSDESHAVAQQCEDSGGVVFVPAMMGLGTPAWDYGARGTLLGLTRGSGRRAGRARGARRCRATRRGSRRGRRCRRRPHDRRAPHRRRDEPEPHLRAGPRRRGAEAGRGLAGEGGDDVGCRLPRGPRPRHLARPRRDRGHLEARRPRGARAPARPRAVEGRDWAGVPLDPRPQRRRLLTFR